MATQNAPPPATQNDHTKWFFLLPAVGWILIFSIFPLLYAIYTSFFSFTTAGKRNQFVGLDNFARLFEDANLHQGLMTTLRFVMATVSVEMILGVLLALLLNREIRGKNILRAIMTLPLFATPVAVGYLAITLYYEENGPINSLIQFFGGDNIPWLSHPNWAQVAIMIVDIWQWTPFVFLVTLAALQGLSQDLYEAAKVDGASVSQLFWRITLPLLRPTLWLVLMLRVIEAFKVNDIPYSLTLGGPGQATKVFTMFTYETSRRFKNHGYGAAQSFLLLIIVSLLVALVWGRIREMYEERR
jgi:multiple sugar transport system permease protein